MSEVRGRVARRGSRNIDGPEDLPGPVRRPTGTPCSVRGCFLGGVRNRSSMPTADAAHERSECVTIAPTAQLKPLA
jgi:hypothetical protein